MVGDITMPEKQTDTKFFFIANYLCIDFINTHIARAREPFDLLKDFDDFVSWLVQAGALTAIQAEEMVANWGGEREAVKVFARALDFRTVLRQMVERIADGTSVPRAAVVQINELLRHQIGHAELQRRKEGFEKHFHADFKEPIHLLWPVAESACDLLAYGNLSLIRKCENAACVFFFYDTTKNHSRRWCSMTACGNRMKVAAHYRRLRASDDR